MNAASDPTADRREAVLASLVRAAGDGVSGERLADELGCSRAAVHRHVEALRRAGITVLAAADGYRLGHDADPIAPSEIARSLRTALFGPIRWSVETGSTNDDAARAARDGAAEGLVIGADLQRSGRGRRGRQWTTAPRDALLFSVLLRPAVAPIDAGLLPLVVAVAVARALGEDARIVWPNDILLGGRKVSGILCEMSSDQERVAWAVAGIGVNVRDAPELTDARWNAGSLAHAGDQRTRADLLIAILQELEATYTRWLEDGGVHVKREFNRRDLLRDRRVTVTLSSGDIHGTCRGIDELGRLLLADGPVTRSLASGEVTRVRNIDVDQKAG